MQMTERGTEFISGLIKVYDKVDEHIPKYEQWYLEKRRRREKEKE